MVDVESWGPDRRALFRLYLELKPGSLIAVLDRLQLAGQTPRLMVFNKEVDGGNATLVLGFDRVNEPAGQALIDWVQQIVGVLTVSSGWPQQPLSKES